MPKVRITFSTESQMQDFLKMKADQERRNLSSLIDNVLYEKYKDEYEKFIEESAE